MATWDPPSDAELDVDKPIKAVDIRRIRDLPQAMAEGAAGAPSIGGLRFIESKDLSSVATADFTGFDASKYDGYVFELANVIPATDLVDLLMRTSTNGGSSYDSGGTDYKWEVHEGSITDNGTGNSSIQINGANTIGSASTEHGINGTIKVNGPHLAKDTMFHYHSGHQRGTDTVAAHGAGFRSSAADVDAVRFLMSSGNLESGTITMYGVANS